MNKLLIVQYILLRPFFKRKNPRRVETIIVLSLLFTFIQLLAVFLFIDQILNTGWIKLIFTSGLPLGPITTVIIFSVMIFLAVIYKKPSFSKKRRVLKRIAQFKMARMYSIVYLAITLLMLIYFYIYTIGIGIGAFQ